MSFYLLVPTLTIYTSFTLDNFYQSLSWQFPPVPPLTISTSPTLDTFYQSHPWQFPPVPPLSIYTSPSLDNFNQSHPWQILLVPPLTVSTNLSLAKVLKAVCWTCFQKTLTKLWFTLVTLGPPKDLFLCRCYPGQPYPACLTLTPGGMFVVFQMSNETILEMAPLTSANLQKRSCSEHMFLWDIKKWDSYLGKIFLGDNKKSEKVTHCFNLYYIKGIVKGSFWRYLGRDGRVFGGNSAGTEEFLEVTRPGRNSFNEIDFQKIFFKAW